MRLAICYSSKNQFELTEQTFPRFHEHYHVLWCDASTDYQAVRFYENAEFSALRERVFGGADAAIAWKLTRALKSKMNFTHIMLLENDVLLYPDWYDSTIDLFARGCADGLEVGAVSPRSYVDRVLIQRDGFAVMHNIGAGAIIFTREAAEIVLRTFRTGYWPSIRYAWSQVSGIDVGTYACFAGNQQPVTTDWQFEHQLLRHGLCALALTPAKCTMIGQVPPLAEQGLELTTGPVEARRNDEAFRNFVMFTGRIRNKNIDAGHIVPMFQQGGMGGTTFFPHQVGHLFAQQQGWRLKWVQGHGPFAFQAGEGGASLSVRICGSCSFMVSGGVDVGANVKLVDTHSGYQAAPQLPPFQGQFIEVTVPGGFMPRTVALGLSEGGVFYGINCADPQLIDNSYSFDWTKLPEVAE